MANQSEGDTAQSEVKRREKECRMAENNERTKKAKMDQAIAEYANASATVALACDRLERAKAKLETKSAAF